METLESIFVIALLILHADVLSIFVCDASLLTVPKSSVAVIGDKVELKCSSNLDKQVVWAFAPSSTSTDVEISFDDDIISLFRSRYKINKSISGQHNLIINSVDVQHAGKYACFHFDTGNKAVAYLTVLDSAPECSANTSNEDKGVLRKSYLWIRCRIIYAGNINPILSWTQSNTEDTLAGNISTSGNRTALMTTTLSVIKELYPDDNGVVFKCKITFQLPNNSQGNAPDYEYTWNHTARVLYEPRNLSIVRYEDRLECSADGNPTPTYRWTDVETNRSVEGPVLTLNFDKALDSDKELNFDCLATNALGTQRKSISQLNNESVGKSTTLSIAGVALILASLSLAGVVFLSLGLGLTKYSNSFNADRAFRRSDSLTRASSIQVFQSPHEQIELHTEELTTPKPADTKTEENQTASTIADYSALTNRQTTTQEPQLYCELRLNDQPISDYIN